MNVKDEDTRLSASGYQVRCGEPIEAVKVQCSDPLHYVKLNPYALETHRQYATSLLLTQLPVRPHTDLLFNLPSSASGTTALAKPYP